MVMNSLTPSTPSIPTTTSIHQQKSPTDSEQFQHNQHSSTSLVPIITIEKQQQQNIIVNNNNNNITNCALIITPSLTTPTVTPVTSSTSITPATSLQKQKKHLQVKTNQKTSLPSLLPTTLSGSISAEETATAAVSPKQSSYSLDFLHSVGAQMTAGITRTPQTPLLQLSTSSTPSIRYSTYFQSDKTTPTQSVGRNLRTSLKFLQQSEIVEDDSNFIDLDFKYEPIVGGMSHDGTINNTSSTYQVTTSLSGPGNSGGRGSIGSCNSGNINIGSENSNRLYQSHPNESFSYYSNYRNHHYFYPHNWNNNSINYQYRKHNSRIPPNVILNNNQRLNNLNHQQHEATALPTNSALSYNTGLYSHQNVSKTKIPDDSITTNYNQQSNLNSFNRIASPRFHSSYNFNNASPFSSMELSGDGGSSGCPTRVSSSGSNIRSQPSHLNYEKRPLLKNTSVASGAEAIGINSKSSQMSISDLDNNSIALQSTHLLHHYSENNVNVIPANDYESDSSITTIISKSQSRHHVSHQHHYSHSHQLMERQQITGSLPSQSTPIFGLGTSSSSEQFSLPRSTDTNTFYETSHQYRSYGSDFNAHQQHNPHQQHQHYHRHQQPNFGQHYMTKTSPHNLYHPSSATNRNSGGNSGGAGGELTSLDSNLYMNDTNQVLLLQNKRSSNSLFGHPKNYFRGRRYWYPNLRTPHHNLHENNTPPDRFLAKAHLIETKIIPTMLLNGTKWDNLSQDIWSKFIQCQQREETYRRKIQLWKVLYLTIKKDHPRYGLYMVGSTISGFGTDSSDIDMCLVYRAAFSHDSRIEALSHLNYIKDYLNALGGVFEQFHVIEARVPILRFRDSQHMLDVDLNFNNCVGIRNTHLLYCYTQLDWRLRPLVLIVKLWAQYHHINNAKTMTISSYSLSLMVIHFLQCGVKPPVLPCLHELYPEKFKIILKSNDFGFVDMIEDIGGFESQNQQCIGELFIQFLQYYSTFNFSKFAISIRTGKLLPIDICRQAQSIKNDVHQWNELCIEEPFDLTNTARSVYDAETFERIKNIFIKSWKRLQNSLDLNQIFMPMGQEHNTTQLIQQQQQQLQQRPTNYQNSMIPLSSIQQQQQQPLTLSTTNSSNSITSNTLQEIEVLNINMESTTTTIIVAAAATSSTLVKKS